MTITKRTFTEGVLPEDAVTPTFHRYVISSRGVAVYQRRTNGQVYDREEKRSVG